MAESKILKDIEAGKLDRQCGYFKAKVLDDHKADSTYETFQESIDSEQTIVFTDKSTSYVNIAEYVEIHLTENQLSKPQKKLKNGFI